MLKNRYTRIAMLSLMLNTACIDFLQVDMPDSRIGKEAVFLSDETAIAATNAMYRALLQNNGVLGGSIGNVTVLSAVSADEIDNYFATDAIEELARNNISVNNSYIRDVWAGAYKAIYECNTVIEGVEDAATLTPAVAAQAKGEALFIRALCHFYLVNLFGDVPWITTTDYRVTAVVSRTPVSEVYKQIIKDLQAAHELLPIADATTERIRPNRRATEAMLARVALYQEKYDAAEEFATAVIDDPAYTLEPLQGVFLTTSKEAIWQLSQLVPNNFPTADAAMFVIRNNFFHYALTGYITDSFETGDNRYTAWVGQWVNTNGTFSFAHKYKEDIAQNVRAFKEYLVVLRLAEQYLIRAEARAYQGNILGAREDIDQIRLRAGLPLLADTHPDITQEELLDRIAQERRIEFFCEMGHRWLDLKRTGKANETLAPIKADWTSHDVLYPIPEREMFSNPFLKPQNPGY